MELVTCSGSIRGASLKRSNCDMTCRQSNFGPGEALEETAFWAGGTTQESLRPMSLKERGKLSQV